jgi:hypothetical protein
MKLVTKVLAVTSLMIGIPITLLTCLEVTNLKMPPQDREDSFAALILLGLPPTLLGSGLLLYGMHRDRQQEQERCRKIFHDLLKANQGEITTIEFAMATGLTGKAAKAYLDELAQEFNASYNVLEEGSISYRFRISGADK